MQRRSILFLLLLLACGCDHPAWMTDDDLLRAANGAAEDRLAAVDDDATRLPEPYKTINLVFAAQGAINNGGLRAFFASDWPHTPPYSEFADAYERIGSVEAAAAIRSAAASFGLEAPEKEFDARRAYIDANYDSSKFNVRGWDNSVCGDKRVYPNLAAWARRQPKLDLRRTGP